MTEPRLYHDLAEWWPLMSPPEEYVEEGELLRDMLQEKLGPGLHTLLDLGVGGGHHLSHLSGHFDATAVDLSDEMLVHSRRLNPSVDHHQGDMRSVRLGRKFDAVLIHDAVAYLLNEDDIRATLETAAEHLSQCGVLIMTPDWYRETFCNGYVTHYSHCEGDTDLTYIEYDYDPDPADTTIETIMFLLIREHGVLRIEQDRHTTGLFSQKTWLKLMREAGFAAETRAYVKDDQGRPMSLLLGTWSGDNG